MGWGRIGGGWDVVLTDESHDRLLLLVSGSSHDVGGVRARGERAPPNNALQPTFPGATLPGTQLNAGALGG